MSRIGFECELDGASAHQYVPLLRERGLWNVPADPPQYYTAADFTRAHPNHCTCPACAFGNSKLRPMLDCTVTAEIVSDPMLWPSDDAEIVLSELEEIIRIAGGQASQRAGFHIHVEKPPGVPVQRVVDYFCWYEHALAVYARQAQPCVRPYNTWLSAPVGREHRTNKERLNAARIFRKVTSPYKGQNLANRHDTYEFRIWNSTVDAWRMHFAIDMTAAFIKAVADMPDIEHTPPDKQPPLLDFVGPHMTDTGFAFAVRHLATLEN